MTADSFDYLVNGDDLLVKNKATGEMLTISGWYKGDIRQFESFQFDDGSSYTAQQIMYNWSGLRLTGQDWNDKLYGGKGNDLLYGNSATDVLDGGAGNDLLVGGSGNDTYKWGVGYGNDTIDNTYTNGFDGFDRPTYRDPGQDIIKIGAGLTKKDLDILSDGKNMYLKIKSTGEILTIQNWYNGLNWQVSKVQFSDGTVLTPTDLNNLEKAVGTAEADVLYGNSGNDTIYGLEGSDTLYGIYNKDAAATGTGNDYIDGGAGDDQLYGQDGDDTLIGNIGNDYIDAGTGNDYLAGGDGNDKLYGQDGNDVLDGGAESDLLVGGSGDDTYLWGNGSGNDTIDNSYISGKDAFWDDPIYGSPGQDIIKIGSGLTVKDLDILSNGSTLYLRIKGTGETLTIEDWYNGADWQVSQVQFSDGTVLTASDIINQARPEGTAGADVLSGNSRNDTIYGLDGNDTIYGVLSPYATATGTGNDYIDGGAGDDQIYGQDGNDTLYGGAGNDSLIGGAGNDTYIWGKGAGNDVINSYGDLDTIHMGEGITAADIDVFRAGYDLQIKIRESGESLTIQNWYQGEDHQVSNIVFSNGSTLTALDLDDRVTAYGTASNDNIRGSNGNDKIYGMEGNDNLYGQDGNDKLFGGLGNDTLSGENGNDILDGNEGNDLLIGGSGDDTYQWGAGYGNDTIDNTYTNRRDFFDCPIYSDPGKDIIKIGAGLTAKDLDIISDGKNMYLKIKSTGEILTIQNWYNGANWEVSQVQFSDGTVLTAADLINQLRPEGTGNTPDNVITGDSANNTLTGGAGSDTLNGGKGADTLIGGIGNDTYIVDNTGDIVTENLNEGIDTVQASITYTLGANVENLTLTGTAAINGTGNTLNNVITGNSANNILSGGAGADTLIGGIGNDTYIVDNTGDIVTEKVNEGTDTVQASSTYTLGANVENLTLTGTAAINGTGNTLNNVITGNSANNILDGGVGADTLIGGIGNDIYIVDNTGDIVTEKAYEGTDTVQANITYTLGANVENLTLTGIAAINGTGNTLNNVITGNSENNILNGGAGADTLIGSTGNDTYIVDNTGDIVTENLNEGTDTVQASSTYTLGANLENLTLTGTAANNGTGNTLNNVITGNNGNNILDGGVGVDTLIGGIGNDIYVVDNTGDIVTENLNEGTDTVQASITYTLGANVENLTLTGTSAINGTGNTFNNVITGNSANNILDGGVGADKLIGGTGNDTYIVDNTGDIVTENLNEGTDTVQANITYTLGTNVENLTLTGTAAINGTGNALNNVITGNSESNILNGGVGADTLIGGIGNDIYVVDNTGDVVTENLNEGIDTVQASITYTLGANVENLTLTGTAAINGIGSTLDNVITGNSAKNTLTGGAGSDTLNGGIGADTLIGGTGDDTYIVDNTGDIVTENLNEGIDTVQSSITYTLGANVENLMLTGTAAINGIGNTLDNVITGNSAKNTLTGGAGSDTLNGGIGADTLIGGTGDDTYIVDNTGDIVTENLNAGTDTVQSNITYTLGANVENLTLTGTAAINGTGNTLDNVIIGNSANNTLTGGAGNDTLYGGVGNDTLIGGAGNDTYVWESGAGNDIINNYATSSDVDTIQFQNLTQAALDFSISGKDLICTVVQTGETAKISNWTLGSSYQVDAFSFTDGTLTASDINKKIAL